MTLKSCTLLACVGGLALAQNARADAPPGSNDPNNPPPAAEDTPPPASELPPCPGAEPPCPAPAQQAPAQPVQPTYYNEAPTEEYPGMYSYAWSDPRLATGIGVQFSIGGGVAGFTNSEMRDVMSSSVSGLWEANAVIGSHVPIGLQLGYVGTAQDTNTFSGLSNGTLIGTTVEGALRWNILPHYAVNPYIFGGVGWQHYGLSNQNFSTADSGMANSSNSVEVPAGLGISLRDMSGFTFDVRGIWRWVNSTDLLIDPRTGAQASLNTWEASAALGYEF